MPALRAFRALRYDPAVVPDVGRVLCPPYDVITPARARALRERDPHNAVRLELPDGEGTGDGERYQAAARELVAWRSAGVLRKDRLASLYVYAETYRTPAGEERTQRGFMCRLRLEPFGGPGGVQRHERTMSGPKEDRYRLLRATGANLSPVIGLYATDGRESDRLLDALTGRPPEIDARDDEEVRHRLWVQPLDGSPAGGAGAAARLLELAGSGAVTIADGHHRYETALRYREERGRTRACESDPPYDYVLFLLFDAAAPGLTVLATHRLVGSGPSGADLLARLAAFGRVEPLQSAAALVETMGAWGEGSPGSRFGIWSDGQPALLTVDADAARSLGGAGRPAVLATLDVSIVADLLERVCGIDDAARVAGAIGYTKDATEALGSVDRGEYRSAFLLDPPPVRAVLEVAQAGEVMPPKSTYFHPKAATGLVFNMLEP